MRFILAIVALVCAAVMIGVGIAQRTIWLAPASTAMSVRPEGEAPYIVLNPSALSAHPGSQTITVTGPDGVFIAYARSADVAAWLGDTPYASVTLPKGAEKLRSTVKQADAADLPAEAEGAPVNPAGSDLWLEEFSGKRSLSATINVPKDIRVIVASDGEAPAPTEVTLSWPVDNATPWAGPLILGGGILLAIGFALYIWGLIHLRRSHGPRRNLPRGPRMPKLPRPKSLKAREITGGGRRSLTRSMTAVVPVLLVSGLALSGCSADFWPKTGDAAPAATPTPALSGAPMMKDVPPPAVTVPQLERIVKKISTVATEADRKLDADAIATRFTGPALEQRLANYKIRKAVSDYPAPPAVPAAPLTLTLPQQSSGWPRFVLTVIQDEKDTSVPPTALVLKQETPRSKYLVEYDVQLEASAKVPDVAPATVGAPIVAPSQKLLKMQPDKLAAAYADILLKDKKSEFYDMFAAKGDSFRTQVGVAKKQEKKKSLPSTASIAFSAKPGDDETVALGTNDSGAIVAVSLMETETVKPVEKGATVSPEGASKALSGVKATTKGIQSTYGDQLLFHVPAAGSDDKIVLLGFSQGLITSAELK
ncbi:hypothetical protein [Cryobacterium tepidiphilum]|uniref:DUF8094 domain-containing protein n=1 Tax=Cryobacterium tepidiphilum TaxID=2486026 RepID=A0A3M8KYV5_9MICO|nr:hypothetical protein [Cryobacterium tepidiphilum]RNE58471.1 hypothetical protein EEJ31_11955 [Cryobacterium tepidiphilum]